MSTAEKEQENESVKTGGKKYGVVMHICNPCIHEAEAGASHALGHPDLYSEILSFKK